jgi:hypothetical protein
MTDETQNGSTAGHGSFEPRDIGTKGVIYFLVGLAAATLLVHFLLAGVYDFLDKRERANQPAMNPLVTNVPEDTRKVAPKYPEKAFPDPRLETDERTQLDDIRIGEEQKLNSYGWVDEKTGTVHIPIEQAMDLLVKRGLPVRSQGAMPMPASASVATTGTALEETGSRKSGKKK